MPLNSNENKIRKWSMTPVTQDGLTVALIDLKQQKHEFVNSHISQKTSKKIQAFRMQISRKSWEHLSNDP